MMKNIDGYNYFAISEYAKETGISKATLYRYIETGKISKNFIRREGRSQLIRSDALEEIGIILKGEFSNEKVKKPLKTDLSEKKLSQFSQDSQDEKTNKTSEKLENLSEFQHEILEGIQQLRKEKKRESAAYREQLKQKDEQLAEKDRQIKALTRQIEDNNSHLQQMNIEFAKVSDQAQNLQLMSTVETLKQFQNNVQIQQQEYLEEPHLRKEYFDQMERVRKTFENGLEKANKQAEEEVLRQLRSELSKVIESLENGKKMYMGENGPEFQITLNLPEKFQIVEELYRKTLKGAYVLGKKRSWDLGWDAKGLGTNRQLKRKEYFDECDRAAEKFEKNKKNVVDIKKAFFPTEELNN